MTATAVPLDDVTLDDLEHLTHAELDDLEAAIAALPPLVVPHGVDPELLAPDDLALWTAMGAAVPRWSPAPTPGAVHELRACRAVARMLGTPLLPWQEWYARVVTERRADGRYRFPLSLLTVPRQAGKTTIVRVVLLTRAILNDDRRAFYTAQTGKDATERWADLAAAAMRRGCPLAQHATLRKAAGSARLTIVPTGSRISPFAPTSESLHGYTPHDVARDELFAFSDAEGVDLEGAILPAQMTLTDRQLLDLSTAGNRSSTYLRRKVDEGRDLVERGVVDVGVGYLEWSLPDGSDPYAPALWRFHPAFARTQHLADFALAAHSLPPGEWLRAMCNVWTEGDDPLFDMAQYDACRVGELAPVKLGEVVVGVGVDPDRSRGALVAAWPVRLDGETLVAVKLLHALDDVPAVVEQLEQLATAPQADRPRIYGAAAAPQVRSVLDEVRRRVGPHVVDDRPRLVDLDAREWQLASVQLHAAIADRELVHELDEGAEVLRSGVERALARPGVEGSWQLSTTSPPELLALAAAVRGVRVKIDTPQVKIRL